MQRPDPDLFKQGIAISLLIYTYFRRLRSVSCNGLVARLLRFKDDEDGAWNTLKHLIYRPIKRRVYN